MDPLLPPADPAVPVRAWTSDEGFVGRVTRVLVRQAFWTRAMRGLVAGLVLVALGLMLLTDTGPLILAPLAVIVGLLPATVAWQTRRQLARQIPAGTTFRAALTPDALWMQGPLGTASTSYAAYRAVTLRSDVVVLSHRHGRMHSALPAALFPGPDLDLLREHVAAAQVSGREARPV
ncbi:hypothetical protein [Cellulomonas biazotea]|uniref:hypothetical protein n=1 Tax=Cellulomonas biazotea TaxID=1709 RepID=UPI0010300D69|nr:hypothetical protein [Cellulomonas biazotea]